MPRDLDQPIRQILVFGAWVVGCATTRIEVWKTTGGYEHYTTLHSVAAAKGDGELTGGVCDIAASVGQKYSPAAAGRVGADLEREHG